MRRLGPSWRKKAKAAALSAFATAASIAGIAQLTDGIRGAERAAMVSAAQQAEAELGRPLTFREFVERVRPGYQWYRHCEVLGGVLQKVADGELKRVMIFMPPRHGKSELASRLFSAYYLYRYPNRWVAICSYGQGLANTLSRAAKANYLALGCPLSQNARAVKQWETGRGGGMWCAGMRGEMTGKGWHLGIIDDPLKNATEAESPVIRDAVRDNYQSSFYTREEPNELGAPDGALVVINTRWHEDDLTGWLLKQEESDDEDDIEHWHIVSFPAIAEEPERDEEGNPVSPWPKTCTVEPDWRQPGEALCPERRPLHKLKRIMKKVGDYFWNAMFQQRPRARDGGMFKREWFAQRTASLPENRFEDGKQVKVRYTFVRYWDKAGTADGGAYTAGVLLALADGGGEGADGRPQPGGEVYVCDVVRGQWSAGKREQKIRETAAADRARWGDVTVWVEQEPGSGGKESAEATLKNLAGFDAHKEPVSGKKELRARPFATALEAGNVWLLEGAWNDAYVEEHMGFPRGTYKDQVDAGSGAYNKLTLTRTSWAQDESLKDFFRNRG